MNAAIPVLARHVWTNRVVLTLALLGTALTPRFANSHTITGHIVADNEVSIYTAANEAPSMTVNYSGVTTCWPTAASVNVTTADSYLYVTCFSDLAVGQGLLHDLQIDGNSAVSGDAQWTVLPTDSLVLSCVAHPAGTIEAAMAARIPTGVFVPTTVGCQNLAAGCYGIWGNVPSINSAAKWIWFNSGQQVSANAPFQPGFNHREFLIFRLNMDRVTPVRKSSWGELKSIYR
jgi:hypothetical protein